MTARYVATVVASILAALAVSSCSKTNEQSAAIDPAACEGPPLHTVEKRNKALEDGYQINQQYDCIDRASFVAISEQRARTQNAEPPETLVKREAERSDRSNEATANQDDPLDGVRRKILALRASGPRPNDMAYFGGFRRDLGILLVIDTNRNRDALMRDRAFIDRVESIVNAEYDNHGYKLHSISFISDEEIEKDNEDLWATSWMFPNSPYPKVEFQVPSSRESALKQP